MGYDLAKHYGLPQCAACESASDPRFVLSTDGVYYPLCDGCAPARHDEIPALLETCRASGRLVTRTVAPEPMYPAAEENKDK